MPQWININITERPWRTPAHIRTHLYPNLFKNCPNIFRTGCINFAEKFKVVKLIPVDEAFASSLEHLLKALPLWLFFNENSLFSEQKRSFLSTGLVSDHFWVRQSDSDDDFPKLIQNLSKFIQKLSKYIQN